MASCVAVANRESNEVNHKNQNIDFDRLTERRPSKKGASNGAMTASFPQFRQISQAISASKPDLGNLAMCLIWGSAKHYPEVRLSRCGEPRAVLRHSNTSVLASNWFG